MTMRKVTTGLYLFFVMIVQKPIYASLDAAYKEGSSVAQSNMQKSMENIKSFNPADVFKNYTDRPSPTIHYQGVTQGDAEGLKTSGSEEMSKNEAASAILKNFANPKLKIDSSESWLNKSRDIIKNAHAIATGVSSNGVNCKEQKICRTVYTKKTCNEQVRNLQKICDKIPKIKSSIKTVACPSCKSVMVAQTFRGGCPSGYSQMVYSDMIQYVDWDDISICVKAVGDEESLECYAGYLVYGISGDNRLVQSSWRGTVPKKAHGRLKFSNVYRGNMAVTIVNETTGQTLYSGTNFTNGQVVELPFSEIQDQTFRFEEPQGGRRGFFGWFSGIGVMLLTFDHIRKEKEAVLESWEEKNCVEN